MKKLFIVAIIPARSGSKGLLNKNIKKINNKHLIYYTINDAKNCDLIKKVVVSTDSIKIKNISEKYGAEVPFLRSKSLSGDKVPSNPVIKDALIKLEKIYKKKIDIVVYLQATEIFRENWMIKKCVQTLINDKKIDSCFVAYETHKNFWRIDKSGKPKRINKFNYDTVRQKKNNLYREDTGLVCASRRNIILKGKRIGGKIKIIPHDYDLGSIDIHNHKQLKIAEKIINIKKKLFKK